MSSSDPPFADAVREHFGFLESCHGFTLTDADDSGVRYQRGDVVVGVFHERLSGELGVGIGRRDHPDELERPYHVAELVALRDLDAGRRYAYHAATSLAALHASLGALATDLRDHGASAFTGDDAIYVRLAAVRTQIAADFPFDLRGRHVRSAAEAAWRAADHAKVAHLYASIEDDLSPTESSRLRDAREHLQRKTTA